MTINPYGQKALMDYWHEQRPGSDFGKIPNRLRKPQVADDPDPTLISQLIETGRAEVER